MSHHDDYGVNRRDFIRKSAIGLAAVPVMKHNFLFNSVPADTTKVALVKTTDRKAGIKTAMQMLEFAPVKNKKVVIKPNFNTASPAPAGTHNDTLDQIVRELYDRGAADITLGERSGPPVTKEVMTEKGTFYMARDLDFRIVNYEELDDSGWAHFKPRGCHWDEGFYVPKLATESEYFVSTCCLKTHGFGGVFTMSLKLAVGLTPKRLMRELHGKSETHMRRMIAEINQGYKPELIVMDGIKTFVDGGPTRGTMKRADVIIAGTDRVAVDATGLAVLKEIGANDAIMGRKIFAQEQIERAVDLGIGIDSPQKIEFVTVDDAGRKYADNLKKILAQG